MPLLLCLEQLGRVALCCFAAFTGVDTGAAVLVDDAAAVVCFCCRPGRRGGSRPSRCGEPTWSLLSSSSSPSKVLVRSVDTDGGWSSW